MAGEGDHNGNGRGRSAVATITPAVVGSLLLGGIFTVVVQAYARDQTRMENDIKMLMDERAALGEKRGRSEQTLTQLAEGVLRNRERIEAAFKELDDKLQREMRLLDDTSRAELHALDGRLQTEIGGNRLDRIDQLDAIRDRISSLEEWSRESWTLAEQHRFEDQLGITRKVPR